MELYGHNLDVECSKVIYQPGQLMVLCDTNNQTASMLLVSDQSPEFLPVMTWAIENNKL
jgi:hypothetical protein